MANYIFRLLIKIILVIFRSKVIFVIDKKRTPKAGDTITVGNLMAEFKEKVNF